MGGAGADGLKLGNTKLAGDPADLEVDVVRGREVDSDFVHIKPEDELLHLYALEAGDGAVLEATGDLPVVVDKVVEVQVAGPLELHHETAVVGEGVVGDGVGEQALGEAILGEKIVHRRGVGLGRYVGGRDGEEEEEQERKIRGEHGSRFCLMIDRSSHFLRVL